MHMPSAADDRGRGTAGRAEQAMCRRWRVVMTGTTTGAPRFGGWRSQPDPDVATVTGLYTGGRTEREIARLLGVSRQRVAETLADAGVARRRPGLDCPLEPDELRRLVEDGATQAELARRFGVASATAGRWLAECGIGDPDPRIDRDRLCELYVVDGRTAREVAAEFGVSHNRVIRELALAGIQRRSQHERVARGRRVSVTDTAIEELYVQRGLTIRELTRAFGVSDEYLRKRLRQAGIAKRPGTFRAKLARSRADLCADATELYANVGLNLREVAAELDMSPTLARELLHEAGVPMRPPGVPPANSDERERRLLADLFADEHVLEVLDRFGVTLQDPHSWTRPSPFEVLAPLPLPAGLVDELYVRLGLSAFHIGLVCGVGTLMVLNRIRAVGLEVRPSGRPCPWTIRTYG